MSKIGNLAAIRAMGEALRLQDPVMGPPVLKTDELVPVVPLSLVNAGAEMVFTGGTDVLSTSVGTIFWYPVGNNALNSSQFTPFSLLYDNQNHDVIIVELQVSLLFNGPATTAFDDQTIEFEMQRLMGVSAIAPAIPMNRIRQAARIVDGIGPPGSLASFSYPIGRNPNAGPNGEACDWSFARPLYVPAGTSLVVELTAEGNTIFPSGGGGGEDITVGLYGWGWKVPKGFLPALS